MNTSPKPAEIVIMASGVVLFIFSFMNWIEVSGGGFEVGWNAWGGGDAADFVDFPGLFPIATIAALLGLGAAVVAAIGAFTQTELPASVAGFTWPQLHLVVAVYAALVTLSFLLLDKTLGGETDGGEAGAGIGLWFSLLAAIGLVVGAVMLAKDEAAPGTTPPQSF